MKLKGLLKFLLIIAVIAFLLKVQYRDALSVKAFESVIHHGYILPSVPADHGSGGEKHSYQKDLIRFELIFVFLVFLAQLDFSFSIFQFSPERIRIPQQEIPYRSFFKRLKSRAPPF